MDTQTVVEALTAWHEAHPEHDVSSLPAYIQERTPLAEAHALAAVAKGDQTEVRRVNAMIGVAARSSTTGKRIHWLQQAGQVMADAYGPHAACKAGCSHCCHIPVKITQAEAVHLGRQIGRKPMPVDKLPEEQIIKGYEAPCPFLVDNKCSVYKHRPTVCRTHLNLDKDDLLCQLQPGMTVPVPYLDTRPLVAASFAILGPLQPIADIRRWFPTVAI